LPNAELERGNLKSLETISKSGARSIQLCEMATAFEFLRGKTVSGQALAELS
jgi:hypothetical protein